MCLFSVLRVFKADSFFQIDRPQNHLLIIVTLCMYTITFRQHTHLRTISLLGHILNSLQQNATLADNETTTKAFTHFILTINKIKNDFYY